MNESSTVESVTATGTTTLNVFILPFLFNMALIHYIKMQLSKTAHACGWSKNIIILNEDLHVNLVLDKI